MLLREFSDHNLQNKTEVNVWNAKKEYVDGFVVDYLAEDGNNILRRLALEEKGATVKYIGVNILTGLLFVDVLVE